MSGSRASRTDHALRTSALAFGVTWLAWRVVATRDGVPGVLFWAIWAVEAFAVVRLALLSLGDRASAGAASSAASNDSLTAPDQPLVSIDIAVLVAGDSAAQVRTALLASLDVVDHERLLLVAAPTPAFQELAQELGAEFVESDGSWSGAVRAAGTRTVSDAVALISAGSVPLRQLVRVARHEFQDPLVAAVQSSRLELGHETPVTWIGGGSVIRATALRSVATLPSEFAATIDLLSNGCKIVAAPSSIVAAQGIEPEATAQARLIGQGADRLRVLRSRQNPLVARGLGLRSRATALSVVLDELSGLAAVVWMSSVIAAVISGHLPASLTVAGVLGLGIPSYALAAWSRWRLTAGQSTAGSFAARSVARIDTSARALMSSLRPPVDPGSNEPKEFASSLERLGSQPIACGLLIALNVAVMLRAATSLGAETLAPTERPVTVALLALGVATLLPGLWGLKVVLSRQSQRRATNRSAESLLGEIDGRQFEVRNLSPGGARLTPSIARPVGDEIVLTLVPPHGASFQLAATIQSVHGDIAGLATSAVGLKFTNVGSDDHDALVRYWAQSWADQATTSMRAPAGSRPALPVLDRRHHRVVRLLTCVGLFATVLAAAAPVPFAGAATPTDSLTLTKDAPATVVYGGTSKVTLTAANTWSATNSSAKRYYNATFRDVLAKNVTYVDGSASPAPSQVLLNQPTTGQTTIIWSNVNDLQPGSEQNVTYSVAHNTSGLDDQTIKVGDAYTNTASVYGNTNPRYVPRFTATGSPVAGSTSATDTASSSGTTTVVPVQIAKSEPSTDAKLLRGIHDHDTIYTLTITNNLIAATNAAMVDDYLPAGLEFLGCGTTDHTPGGAVEYPGAPRLDASTVDLTVNCPAPNLVETVQIDPDGSGPLSSGVYTHVRWAIGNLAKAQVRVVTYRAGIPNRANELFPSTPIPAVACGAAIDSCAQVANLANNTGPVTTETLTPLSLRNGASITGTYTGRLNTGVAPTQTWDRTIHTVTAKDLRIKKSACNATPTNPQDPGTGNCLNGISYGGETTWTLKIDTGEYRSVGQLSITDTLPDGLEYIGGSGSITNGVSTVTPFDPTVTTFTTTNVGTQSLVWDLASLLVESAVSPTLATNAIATVTFRTSTLPDYRATGQPVLSFDGLTNQVATTASTTVVRGDDETGAQNIADSSEATIRSSWSRIDKQTLSGTAAANTTVAIAGTNYQCSSGVVPAATAANPTIPRFAPNDIACFDLRVDFPANIRVRNAVVTDFLPANSTYLGYSRRAGHTPDELLTTVGPYGPGQPMVWAVGTPSGADPRFTSAKGSTFHVVIALRISDDPSANNNYDVIENLLKVTGLDTAGHSVSLRDASTFVLAEPELKLVKGVTDVVRAGASITGFPREPVVGDDSSTVIQGDTATFRIDVPNVGPQFRDERGTPSDTSDDLARVIQRTNDQIPDARAATIWDNLPTGLSCSALSGTLPTTATLVRQTTALPLPVVPSVTLTDVSCTANRISFTASVIPAGYSLRYSYTMLIPTTAAAGAKYKNTAGVRNYSDIGGGTVYYPATNIDPTVTSNSPVASDPATVMLPSATVAKSRTTAIVESGNNAADQATIGERVTFTVKSVVPARTSLYNAIVADTLPAGFSYEVGSAVVTSLPTTAYDATTFSMSQTATGWSLAFPAMYQNDDSTDRAITVTYTAIVRDVVANVHAAKLKNSARLTWNDAVGGTKIGDTTSSATTTVVEPAPTITKAHSPAGPFAGGDQVTYSLTVGNSAGRSPLHEVVVTDCVPAGLGTIVPTGTRLATVGSGAPCAAAQTRLTWSLADLEMRSAPQVGLQPAESIVLTYTAKLDSPAVAATDLVNTAKIGGSSISGTVAGERSTYTASVNDTVKVKTLALTKAVNPAARVPGQQANYSLAVTIPAKVAAYDATIIDTLPANVAFDAYGPFGLENFSAGCIRSGSAPHTIANVAQNSGWFLGDVTGGDTPCVITISYTAHVRSGATTGDVLTNTARLFWNITNKVDNVGSLDTSGFDRSLSTTASLQVVEPKLTLDKGVNTATRVVQGGQVLSYTLTLGNTGGAPAFDITTTDVVPVGLGVPTAFSGTCVNAGSASFDPSTRTITWVSLHNELIGLTPTTSCTLTYNVTVDAADADPTAWNDGQALTNVADIGTYFGDPNHDGPDFKTYDGPTDRETVNPYRPQMSVAKTTGNGTELDQAVIGQPFTWALTITNSSKYATAYGVDVSDQLPKNWTFTSVTSQTPSKCSAAPSTPAANPQVITWTNLCDLAPGATIVIRYTATPQAGAATDPGLLDADGVRIRHVNTATITASDLGGSPLSPISDSAAATVRTVDLQIRKTDASPDNDGSPISAGFTVGLPGYYFLDVKNNGPDTESGPITVTDTMPLGLTIAAATSTDAGWVCTISPDRRDVSCTHPGTLAADANLARITLRVDVGLAALNIDSHSGRITNSATVAGRDTDRNVLNNTDIEPTPVRRSSDFTITKSLDISTPFVPGQQVRYVLTPTNLGPSPAVGPVTVTDPLPSRLRFVSAVGTGWDCSASSAGVAPSPGTATTVGVGYSGSGPDDNGSVSCVRTVADFPIDAALDTVIVTATIDPGTPPSPPVVNVARVTHPFDSNPSNDTNDAASNPRPVARLTIDKDDGDATFTVGQRDAKYYVTVTNQGPSREVGPVVVSDSPPAQLKLLAVAGLGWSCTVVPATGFATGANGSFSCTWIGADPGADAVNPGVMLTQLTMTIEVGPGAVTDPAPGATNNVANTASVTGVTDPTPRTDTEITPVIPKASLTIDKSHDGERSPWKVGETGDFQIVVANSGPSGEYGPVTVTDQLPDGLEFISAAGSGWRCELQAGSEFGPAGTIRCTFDRGEGFSNNDALIRAGGSLPPISVQVNVLPSAAPLPAPAVNTVTNTATVNGSTDREPHADDDTIEVQPIADLQIVKTHVGNGFEVGTSGTYSLAVTNNGPNVSAGPITVVDTLPNGLSFTSAVGTGWTCSTDPAGQLITCTHPDTLAVDESTTITVVAEVGADAYGAAPHELANTATVSGTTLDPNPENNDSTDTVTVAPLVDLAIDKSHTGNFEVGTQGVFSIIVTNLGPNIHPASDITVLDELPAGLKYSSVVGDGWICSAAGTAILCTHGGPLAVGAQLPALSITVDVTALADGGVTNVATVSTSVAESTLTNNRDTDSVTIIPSVALVLTKRLQGSLVPGELSTYVISVRNDGPSDAEPPTIIDDLPSQLEGIAAVGDGFQCDVTPQRMVCVRSEKLPARTTATVTITVRVRPGSTGTVTNAATVSTPPVGSMMAGTNASSADNIAVAVEGATITRPGTTSPLAWTGANVFRFLVAALALMVGGFLMLAGARRRSQIER